MATSEGIPSSIDIEFLELNDNPYNSVEEPAVDVPPDADDCRRIREHKGDGVLVANICFFDKIKGLDVLIRALALLPAHYRLLLIGNGAEDGALQQLAQRLCPGRVLFLGRRPRASRYLSLVDVFAQTSWSEGFCLSMAEAALTHTPIVSSDIPGMREKYGADEVTYFPAGDAPALAVALREAVGDEAKADRAYRKVVSQFGVEQMITRYETIYQG